MATTMEQRTARPYGLWDSPITPVSLAQSLRLSDVAWDTDGETLVWLEGRSDRGVLVCARQDDPAPRDLTSDLSVRATVGYGGGDFAVGHGIVYFVSGGRLYRQTLAGGTARPITPAFGSAASPRVSPDGRWVLFVHSVDGDDVLAVVDSEGSGWPVKVAQGRDFYMQPCWDPDGSHIAWIAWDNPNMPWDGTELWVADFDHANGTPMITNPRRLAGGRDVSVFQPQFLRSDDRIVYVSDETGLGQLYTVPLSGGGARRLTGGDGEYGRPAWSQGMRAFAVVQDADSNAESIVAVRNDHGFHRLQRVSLHEDGVRDIPGAALSYTTFDAPAGSGSHVAVIASSSVQPTRVISLDSDTGDERVWARSAGETVLPSSLAEPEPVTWPTTDGDQAHGLFYPPRSDEFHSAGLPPLIVLVHGGPTSQVTASFQAQTQFFTSRGYAVLQVNYRGSTGYGRDYMLKLRGNWGLHDTEDSRTGALYLAEQGKVDPRRRVIMGGSAGGYTVLQSLVHHPGFYTAGICLFGVSNQFTLASDTHKFEARYLDTMLGPLPEAAAIYRERSPIFFADRITDPIAVFQGTIDQVVPRAQSDEIVESLKERKVPHEYHVYEGEGHGWRRSDTIEAFYRAVDRFLRQYVVFA
jgi:dipeptidyl aminopeptidase/acylaminoacyl peptidase